MGYPLQPGRNCVIQATHQYIQQVESNQVIDYKSITPICYLHICYFSPNQLNWQSTSFVKRMLGVRGLSSVFSGDIAETVQRRCEVPKTVVRFLLSPFKKPQHNWQCRKLIICKVVVRVHQVSFFPEKLFFVIICDLSLYQAFTFCEKNNAEKIYIKLKQGEFMKSQDKEISGKMTDL